MTGDEYVVQESMRQFDKAFKDVYRLGLVKEPDDKPGGIVFTQMGFRVLGYLAVAYGQVSKSAGETSIDPEVLTVFCRELLSVAAYMEMNNGVFPWDGQHRGGML